MRIENNRFIYEFDVSINSYSTKNYAMIKYCTQLIICYFSTIMCKEKGGAVIIYIT